MGNRVSGQRSSSVRFDGRHGLGRLHTSTIPECRDIGWRCLPIWSPADAEIVPRSTLLVIIRLLASSPPRLRCLRREHGRRPYVDGKSNCSKEVRAAHDSAGTGGGGAWCAVRSLAWSLTAAATGTPRRRPDLNSPQRPAGADPCASQFRAERGRPLRLAPSSAPTQGPLILAVDPRGEHQIRPLGGWPVLVEWDHERGPDHRRPESHGWAAMYP